MKTAYDLFRQLLEVMADIDRILDNKSKVTHVSEQARLDRELDILESQMLEIKNQLKNIEVR